MPAYLVIGYGNELRGDDGAGRAVAARIEAMALEGVTVRSVTQLVPELSLDLAAADHVLFVDADVTVSEPVLHALGDRRAGRADPPTGFAVDSDGGSDGSSDEGRTGPLTHHVNPEVLVGLTAVVGERAPTVVEQLSIPAMGFDLGASLSPATARAVDRAVMMIVERISSPAGEAGS